MSRFDLERQTRKLLRAEIRRSPAIFKEYRRRHYWDWVWYIVVALAAPPFIFGIPIIGPLMLTGPLLIGLLPRFLEVKNPHLGPWTLSEDMLLGGEAMVLAAVVCMVLTNGWNCFCVQKDLIAAAYWPVSDRELNLRNLKSWLSGLLYLAYALIPLTITIALSSHHSIWQWGMLLITLPLNLWHLMALAVVCCSAIRSTVRPNPSWVMAAAFGYLAAFYAGASFLYDPSLHGGFCEFMLMAPTGWVNGAIRHLFFEPHPLVIGYVAALAATWIYAANWLRKGFRIRELYLAGNGSVTPVFDTGLLTPPEALFQLPQPAAPTSTESDASQSRAAQQSPTPDSVRAKVRRLLWHSWDGCGWLERLLSRRVTKRQKTILEYVYRGHPRWTLAALISTGVTLAGISIASGGYFLAAWLGHRPQPETIAAMGFMMWLLMTLFVEVLTHQRSLQGNQQLPTYTGLHPVFPVELRELMTMQRTMVVGRMSVWLMQLLAISSLDWLFSPKYAGLSCLWACEFTVLFALFLDTFGWLMFTASAPQSLNWRRFGALAGFAILGCLWLYSAFLVFIPFSYVAVPAFAVVLLCSFGVRAYACWIYRTAIDFECRETVLTKGR